MKDERIKRILRVDYAGEYGAVRIYKGQHAILKSDIFYKMQQEEQEHLQTFENLMITNKVAPSLFLPVWHIGGFALGALTALLGEKVAHACTIAVEEVIDNHYKKQLDNLNDDHQDLKKVIEKHQIDECLHREKAIEQGGKKIPFFNLIHKSVQCLTKKAIWISERI